MIEGQGELNRRSLFFIWKKRKRKKGKSKSRIKRSREGNGAHGEEKERGGDVREKM